MQVDQPIPTAVLWNRQHRGSIGLEGLSSALSRYVKDAVEVGGDKAQRSLPAARQTQQRRLRISGTFATEFRLQGLRKCATDGQTLPRQASLQQIKGGIKLPTLEGLMLNLRIRKYCPVQSVDLLHQLLEARQPCGIGNTRPTEKHHAAFLVRLQECIGDIWAIGGELHSQLASGEMRKAP